MASPRNLMIISQHRSGSTHLSIRSTWGLGYAYGATSMEDTTARNLGELTGWGAYYLPKYRTGGGGLADEARMVPITGTDFFTDHMLHWKQDPDGALHRARGPGSLLQEVKHREDLLASNSWTNHVCFKIQPWIDWPEMSDRLLGFAEKADAHYVILWRRDMYRFLVSKHLLSRTGQAHGTIKMTNGKKFRQALNFKDSLAMQDRYLKAYLANVERFAKHTGRALCIETQEMNHTNRFVWPDGTFLDLPESSSIDQEHKGSSNYTDEEGRRLTAADLLTEDSLEQFQDMAYILENRFDWSNAVPSRVQHK